MYIADSLPLTTQRLSRNQCLILDHRLKSINVYQGRHFINVIVFDGITKSRGTSIDHTGGKIGVPDSRFHGKHLVIPYFTHRKGRVHVSPKMTPKLKLPLAKCHKNSSLYNYYCWWIARTAHELQKLWFIRLVMYWESRLWHQKICSNW